MCHNAVMLLLAKILISSAGMLKMSCNAHSATIRPRTDADGRGRTSSSLSASLSSLPFISLWPQIMFTKLSGQRGDNDGGDDNQDEGHDPKTSPKMWFIPHEKRGKTPFIEESGHSAALPVLHQILAAVTISSYGRFTQLVVIGPGVGACEKFDPIGGIMN